MKRYCKGLTIDADLVSRAYGKWLKSQSGKKSSWKVPRDFESVDGLVSEIANEIENRCLSVPPVAYETRHDSMAGKDRVIGIQSVKQQILDYVAIECLQPLIDARLGYYQCAAIKGKGPVFAKRAIEKWVRESTYFVKLDIKQCYPSADGKFICDKAIRPYIASDDVMYLCEFLLGTYGGSLSIGSYYSLNLANLALSFAYHFAEDKIVKTRRGKSQRLIAHQLYYLDDILLMGDDKRDLKMAVRMLEKYLRDGFGWHIKSWKICMVAKEPIDMCGFVMRPDRTTVRTRVFIRAKRSFNRMDRHPGLQRARRVISYYGYFKHSDSMRFMAKHPGTVSTAKRYVRSKETNKRNNQ